MTTERTNWAAVAVGTTAIAALAAIIGSGARDDAAATGSDALVARLSAAIEAAPVAAETPEALAAATRSALDASAPAQVASDEDFASGWANASGTRYVPGAPNR